MSIVMDLCMYDDQKVSQQDMFSRALADNASQISYYEEYLEKLKYLPKTSSTEIHRIRTMIQELYREREQLSEKYLAACREKK